jgi:hypothetical protein
MSTYAEGPRPAGHGRPAWITRPRAVLFTAIVLLAADALVVAAGVVPHSGHRGPTVGVRSGPATDPTTTVATTTAPPATTTTQPAAHPSGQAGRGYGSGESATTAAAPSPPPCGAACVTIDATAPYGTVNHAGAGLLFVSGPSGDRSTIESLGTTMFRSAPAQTGPATYDWTSWDTAAGSGIPTTLVFPNLWYDQNGGHPPTPWSNWTTYTNWVQTTVSDILASGQKVDYWDIFNEPGWKNYYSPADFQTETPGDLLQQFLVTYQAIKSLDPSAAIVGPSIGKLVFSPLSANDPTTHEPDMTTFLHFAADHRLQLAAVAWHDNGQTPATLNADAQRVWGLIRSLPALGHPQMFLDEYGSKRTQPIPGWDIGYLSMIESAHIGSAVRSCWDGCQLSTLDGLFTSTGQPTSEYFVRTAYAKMSGQMTPTSSTSPSLVAIGSSSPAGRQVRALIGRMAGCAVLYWCQHDWWPPSSTPVPPEDVQVNVNLPWSAPNVSVVLNCDPFYPGAPSGGPSLVTAANQALRPDGSGGEILSFTIPSFADGSAYSLVVNAS